MTITAHREGRVGHVLLNRPQALNALDLGMIRGIADALRDWRDDPAVHAVVVEGAGGRAFCAGGDIRAVREASLTGRDDWIEAFFTEEYALNQVIADYPKPYIALVDGICMGGGIGVSVHGSARVTTAAAVFAMPETGIGLFPDIGASYILPRLRGAVGLYMALTGARLTGADAVFVGLATHFTARETIADLGGALAKHGAAALAGVTVPVDAPIAAHMDAIDRCFGAGSVADVIRGLEAEDSAWGQATLTALRAASPSSVMWTWDLIRAGAGRSLPDCLAAELTLVRQVTKHPDFLEGVRAMVVDKDRAPQWQPPRLEDVATFGAAAMGEVSGGV